MIAPAPASTLTTPVVPLTSPTQIHTFLVEAFRVGNRARLRFARLLAALADSRQFLQLGHPSIVQYAECRFGMQRTETYEHLRVAEAIDALPACREAFEDGNLSWSALKQITRVATSETEAAWLAFAGERTCAELKAEVQDAADKNRAHPRTDRYGLPNLTVKFTLELTLEEQERLNTALEKAGAEIAPALGKERLEPRDVVLYMAERFLKTDAEGTPEGRQNRSASPYNILYHQCPDCRLSRVMTADGPVEVAAESVARLAGDAVEEMLAEDSRAPAELAPAELPIDRPNPAALARRVKLRDGDQCQNPGCGQRGNLHAHHIEFRSHGGRTVASNEISTCQYCHSLLHAGLLRISGDLDTGLKWQPRSETIQVDSAADAAVLLEIPVARTVSAIADAADRVVEADSVVNANGVVNAGTIDHARIEAVSGALVRLGFSKKEARARVEKTWHQLAHDDLAQDDLAQDGLALDVKMLLTRVLRAS